MKILAIRLRNLNSLFGSWSIDLTIPEYVSSGIFAITGPTGAGKSTILDAISLALFARTPRLGHVSKGSNEIMSRRAGDCFAEVDFTTSHGSYRCHWAQHRARRSPDGDLQPPRHEIVDATTNAVLETRSKEVGRLVEQLTGMDYDRFTRSILLAQGEFAAFLQAEADQRAPILEQITGTAIYSRISIAVHERTSEERKKAALCRERLGSITLLDEDEEQQIQASINECTVQAAARLVQIGKLDAALHHLAHVESLQQQRSETGQQLQTLRQRRDEARPDLLRYDRGQRAQSLVAEYSIYAQQQGQVAALAAKIEVLAPAIEAMRLTQQQCADEHAAACQQVQESLALQQQQSEVIKVIRGLDQSLGEKKQQLDQQMARQHEQTAEKQGLAREHQQLERRLAETRGQLDQLTTFFREHPADSILVEQMAGLRHMIHQLAAQEETRHQLEQALKQTLTQQAKHQQQLAQLCQQEAQAAHILSRRQQHLKELTARYDAILEGMPLPDWRLRAEQENLRLQQLEKTQELLARQQSFVEEQRQIEHALAVLRGEEQRQREELKTLEQTQALQQQLVTQYELNHQLALRMRNLYEERQHLTEGEPCPLCGSLQHPWAVEVPQVDASSEALTKARLELEHTQEALAQKRESQIALVKDREHHQQTCASIHQQHTQLEQIAHPLLIQLVMDKQSDPLPLVIQALKQSQDKRNKTQQHLQSLDHLESERQRLRLQTEEAGNALVNLRHHLQEARHTEEITGQERRRIEQQMAVEKQALEHLHADLLRQIEPLGLSQCVPGNAQALLTQLEARLHVWKTKQSQLDQLERHQLEAQGALEKQELLLTALDQNITQQRAEIEALTKEQARLSGQREVLFGNRNPDAEERQLSALVQQHRENEQQLLAQRHSLDKQMHAQSDQLRLSHQELAELQEQAQATAANVSERILAAGFGDLEEYRQALLPQDQLARLAVLQKELETSQSVLDARLMELDKAVARALEEGAHHDAQEREELMAERERLKQAHAELQQQIGADRERFAGNNKRKQQYYDQRQTLAAQEKELERWELLHLLIGSADGKKFRIFAQGLTFEVMISHANRQLRKMSDRYILLRDPQEPLALQVIDTYQAGEMRSTRNLSGGESFLVSLALSLGLSAMASHNVRVDSLFLDEGFGTLDEEALDTALQTLAELRQSGKLIGIISHVPALKECIDTQIQVLPGTGGNSRLIGPGCNRLA